MKRLLSCMALALGSGCLDMRAIPTGPVAEADTGAAAPNADSGDEPVVAEDCANAARDPLLGEWRSVGNPAAICEFFSNARFHDGCDVQRRGDPGDFHRLDDGRYYFGALNAFGENIGECIAQPSFASDCTAVTLTVECDRNGNPFTLDLERVEARGSARERRQER